MKVRLATQPGGAVAALCLLAWVCALVIASSATAADNKPKASESAPTADKLAADQAKLRARYKDLEQAILRMSELMKQTDPKRAALLRQAFAHSRDANIEPALDEVVRLLEKNQLFDAKSRQDEVQKELARLLELLLSGDRSKQVENEKARIRAYITRLNGIIKEQKGVQGRTAGENPTDDTANRQGKVADKTDELAKDIAKTDEANAPKLPATPPNSDGKTDKPAGDKSSKPSDKGGEKGTEKSSDKGSEKSTDKPSGDKPAGDKPSTDQPTGDKTPDKPKTDQPKTDKPQGDKPKNGDKPKSDSPKSDKPGDKPSDTESDGDPSKPSDKPMGKPMGGMPPQPGAHPDGDPNADENPPPKPDDQANRDQTPGRKRIKSAEERMRDAQKKLEKAQKAEALKDQEKAIEELERAKAELEEILRQLREEEAERVLSQLETRFRNMLRMQLEVNEETVKLDSAAAEDRDREELRAADVLSKSEAKIVSEADRALALLREEGSAAALPEAAEQARDDMDQVRERLARGNTGEITQGIEKEIVAQLEEIIAAIQKAQKDQKKKKKPPMPGQGGGEPQDPPLVDTLSEIKMIRALQMRVNTRHERYSKLVEGEQAKDGELIDALRRLSDRQERAYKVLRDIVSGKTQ